MKVIQPIVMKVIQLDRTYAILTVTGSVRCDFSENTAFWWKHKLKVYATKEQHA